jgi:hypothetical protein
VRALLTEILKNMYTGDEIACFHNEPFWNLTNKKCAGIIIHIYFFVIKRNELKTNLGST